MNGRRYLAVSILFLLAVTVALAQSTDDPLADVKRLYASAAYDEALAELERLGGRADANRIDEYRAQCLLGLGRTREAERVVEGLVMRHRSSTEDFATYSPKFVTLYREAKRRALPFEARALYASAKASFDNGLFGSALAQFDELLSLLGDPEEAPLSDLRMLADGFRRLSQQRVVASSPPARQSSSEFQPPPARDARGE